MEEYQGEDVNVVIRYRPGASTCPAEYGQDECEYFDVAADVVIKVAGGRSRTYKPPARAVASFLNILNACVSPTGAALRPMRLLRNSGGQFQNLRSLSAGRNVRQSAYAAIKWE